MRNAVSIRIALVLCWLGAASGPILPQQQSGPKDQSPSKDLGELSLEDLMEVHVDTVYGAAKFEQKITEAPSSVTIVSADQIRKYGYRTFADILRSMPGFY